MRIIKASLYDEFLKTGSDNPAFTGIDKDLLAKLITKEPDDDSEPDWLLGFPIADGARKKTTDNNEDK